MSDSFAIVVATFYKELGERLVIGAQKAFSEKGAGKAEVFEVPGAFELPPAALTLASSGRFAGVVCLGAVIRGETDHYDFVASESARGIMDVQLQTGIPCGYGVVTCNTMSQALARSGGDHRDVGYNAALAALALADIRRSESRA